MYSPCLNGWSMRTGLRRIYVRSISNLPNSHKTKPSYVALCHISAQMNDHARLVIVTGFCGEQCPSISERGEWKCPPAPAIYVHGSLVIVAALINPRRMHEGYGSTVVVLCVCLSVTTLAATYLVYKSKLLYYKVPYGVPNAWFVWYGGRERHTRTMIRP